MVKRLDHPKRNEPLIVDVQPVVRETVPPVLQLPTNPRWNILFGLLILGVGLGGFLYWSMTAELDEGAPVMGSVVTMGERKTVQFNIWGVVRQIFVHDGDHVHSGQPLLQLDDNQERAAIEINQNSARALKVQLDGLQPLVESGYYPRNQFLELQRQYDDAQAKLALARHDDSRTLIRAPVEGTVMGSTVFTVGGTIQPGMRILEIEPAGEPLVLDVRIPINLIDRIHAGLTADVRLTALNQSTTPVLQGTVIWVSPDRQQEPQRPEAVYYAARIKLTPESLKKIQSDTLQPGMPAEVIIKTGGRTFWNYLIKPLTDRAALSLKER